MGKSIHNFVGPGGELSSLKLDSVLVGLGGGASNFFFLNPAQTNYSF